MSNFKQRVSEFTPRSIYIIKCEEDFYYIGESKTRHLDLRIRQQFGEEVGIAKQSDFCKIHKPVEVVATYDLGETEYEEAEMVENAWTKIYVGRYGSDKVMGGIACLSDNEKQEISSNTKDEILGNCEIDGLD